MNHLVAFQKLTLHCFPRWSLAFIRGTVSAWVRCRGGWRGILRNDANIENDNRMYQNTMDVINQVKINELFIIGIFKLRKG